MAAIILILLFTSMLGFSTYWYCGERSKVATEFDDRHNMTRLMLHQSIIWIDRGLVLYEEAFKPDLIKAMALYQNAYNMTEGDLNLLNLSSLKQQYTEIFNGEWDLYVIDNGVVTHTTFSDDFGLDFKKYPSLYMGYTNIQNSGNIVIDRTVKGFAKDAPYRKFAYQGTFDKRYLLEVSRNFQRFKPEQSNASYREVIKTTMNVNPYIEHMDLFNSQYKVISSHSTSPDLITISSKDIRSVKATFTNKTESLVIDSDNNYITEYLFIPVEDTGAPSTPMMHLVARIVYSTDLLHQKYLELTILYFCFIFITILIAILIAVAISRHLTRPLNRIGDDVDRIASGDLDHQIASTGAIETERIERSISHMVSNLKEKIENIRISEEELK